METGKVMTNQHFPRGQGTGAPILGTRATLFSVCYEAKFFNFDDDSQTVKNN